MSAAVKKAFSILTVAALLTPSAPGFDTRWHQTIGKSVGSAFGFSTDATNIMQMGNFSPDFFGPVAELAAQNVADNKALAALNTEGVQEEDVKQFAIFLHFDDLNGDLARNSQFDLIFNNVLRATQSALADFGRRNDVDERTRKVLVLMTLGASLHLVQDFYSHSDWLVNDFNASRVKMVQLPGGELRAPTWFEFRDKMGNPDKWPIQVHCGLYPPVAGQPLTHTHMNHDNSRLVYKEYEDPGQPVVSQVPYHNAGPVPANPQDPTSARAHQQLAVNTAIAASMEWVRKVEENSAAQAAIEAAKTWDLRSDEPKLEKELEAGMAAQMALSCAAGKWDGDDPPADQAGLCRSVLGNKVNPIASGTNSASKIEEEAMGALAKLGLPVALRFTGKFWSVHSKYNPLGKLASGIAGKSGHYGLRK